MFPSYLLDNAIIGTASKYEIVLMKHRKANYFCFCLGISREAEHFFDAAVKTFEIQNAEYMNFACYLNYLLVHINAARKKNF